MKKGRVRFYFESFLITFSAFLGGIVSLVINNLWLSDKNFIDKLSWSILIFTLTLISVLLILYFVIYYIGRFSE